MLTCASLQKRFTHCHFLTNSRSVWATFKDKKEIKETSKTANYLTTSIISSGTKFNLTDVLNLFLPLAWLFQSEVAFYLPIFYRWTMILAKGEKKNQLYYFVFLFNLFLSHKKMDHQNIFFFSDSPFRLFSLNVFVVCWNAWKQFQTDNRFNTSAILRAV